MSDVESMVSNFYAAASGRCEWSRGLDGLSSHMGLWAAQLVGVDKKSGALRFSAEGGPGAPGAALDYLRHYHAINPRIPLVLAAPMGEWLHCHEHLDERFVASSPFYQEFLIPHGGRYLSSVKLIETDDMLFLLGLLRGRGSEPLNSRDRPLLTAIQHHVKEAVRNFIHLRSDFAELGIARHVLGQIPQPMVLVDETRGVWHKNAPAKDVLSTGDVVREANGYFVCCTLSSDQLLTEAIHSLGLSSLGARTACRRRAVPLDGSAAGGPLAFVSAVFPNKSMSAFGPIPLALILIHQPSSLPRELDPLLIAECFDLTPAEARVTLKIAEGYSPKDIAQLHCTSISTVRAQIQTTLHKTGVNRQVDLVRLLLTLP